MDCLLIDRATKLIAKIRQREVIIRDANRIHHFYPDGICSCQDHFWRFAFFVYFASFFCYIRKINLYTYEQVFTDLAGSCRKDAGKSPDPAGKHGKYLEHGSTIPARNFSDFFRWFPEGSSRKALEVVRIHRKKSGKFPTGILLPTS